MNHKDRLNMTPTTDAVIEESASEKSFCPRINSMYGANVKINRKHGANVIHVVNTDPMKAAKSGSKPPGNQ